MTTAQFSQCFVAAIGTLVADAVTYPIELIATMVKSANGKVSALRTTANVIRHNGLASLYKGFSTITYTALLPNIVYFNCYEWLKQYGRSFEQQSTSKSTILVPFIASSLAECAFVAVMVPFDTIQTRMQLQTHQYNYRGLAHGLMDVVHNEGFFRLFSASPLYVLQLLTFTPLQFTAYEWLKAQRLQTKPNLSLAESVYFTFISTTVAAIITNPVNTLIVKFQVENYAKDDQKATQKARQIIRECGMRELNKGFCIRILERNINALFYLPLYEIAGQYFNAREDK